MRVCIAALESRARSRNQQNLTSVAYLPKSVASIIFYPHFVASYHISHAVSDIIYHINNIVP